ncbi:MAG: aminopeptidase P family protein [Chloroflexi bacterium]|nr:aminopeptidase P family protein [Chloroflexota bacterium]
MTKQRIERLREKLEERKLDALFIASPETSSPVNRRYLSGFTGTSAYLLITRDDAVIVTDFRYYEQAEQQATDFRLHKAVGGMEKWLSSLFSESPAALGGRRVAFEAAHVSYQTHRMMQKVVRELPETQRPKLVATSNLVEGLRTIKEPEELAALQAAVDLGDAAFEHVAERVEPGWTERQLAWELEKYIREHGGDGLSFDTLVGSGERGAMPHCFPTDRVLNKGEGVVIDMGVELDGYMSDLTRTIYLGKPDDRFKRVYDIVLAAQQAAEELVEAGMTGEQAHLLAHNVIDEAGHGDDFGHGLGHGVGLEVHESPRLGKTSNDVLADGMVFTIEPGIYLTEWGGVRIEDMVVMENGKARLMSHAPKLMTADL